MPFRFHRQPQKAFYVLCGAVYLFVRLPWWAARNLHPSWRPRTSWSLARSLFVEVVNAATAIMVETSLPVPDPLERLAQSANKTGFVWVEATPGLITGDIRHFAELNGVEPALIGGFWYGQRGPDDSVGQRASPKELVVYNLHGGGFVLGSGSPSFSPSATTFKGLLEHLPQVSRLFALEYRLASGSPFPVSNPFPASLIDVIAGYNYLVHQVGFSPQNIIISGGSAGGILAYQLARHLAYANFPTLPQAGALLLLSPSADSALRRPPGSMRSNARSDYTRTWFDAAYASTAVLGSLPREELDKTWLSPGSPVLADADVVGLFVGFPRTFILAGEAEMSRDSMRTLRDRMRADMDEHNVAYVEVADAPHDFLAMTMFEPGRTVGLKEIAKWLQQV